MQLTKEHLQQYDYVLFEWRTRYYGIMRLENGDVASVTDKNLPDLLLRINDDFMYDDIGDTDTFIRGFSSLNELQTLQDTHPELFI